MNNYIYIRFNMDILRLIQVEAFQYDTKEINFNH